MMKRFQRYIFEKHGLWLWVLLFTILSQGTMLLTNTIGVDTADAIHTMTRTDIQAELSVGRQGIVWVKYLTGHILVNPLFAGVFTILALTLAAMLWNYLFYYVSGIEDAKAAFVFSLVLCSSTVLMEVFYFKVQSLEIAIGMCLAALSLLFTYLWVRGGHIGWLAAAVGLMLVYMSTYQALVMLFVVGAQMCFLLRFGNYFYASNTPAPDAASSEMRKFIWKFILAFALGFGLNELLSKLFFSGGTAYIDKLIFWGQRPFTECLYHIGAYSFKALIGIGIYYPETYLGIAALSLLLLLMNPAVRKPAVSSCKVLFLLDILFLIISPAYLPIAIGGRIPHRAQITLPFVLAFFAWLTFALPRVYTGKTRHIFSCIAVVLVFLTCYRQVSVDLDLGYTDQMRYQIDSAIAHDLIRAIDTLQGEENYPVAFVGSYEKTLNPSCVMGEVTGHSMFAWDVEAEPVGVWSGGRCLAFLNCLGGDYVLADNEEIAAAYAGASDMPAYPAQDCVQLRNGIIVVKLSEP